MLTSPGIESVREPQATRLNTPFIEALENRRLLAASPVYDPGSTVRGQTIAEWSVEWWQQIFATPVYAPDGKTVINPQIGAPLKAGDVVDPNIKYAYPSEDNKVFFLAGSFLGGTLNRTVTIPTGTPVLIPVINSEWSNPDTPAAPTYTTLPGNYTAAQLAHFADVQTQAVDQMSVTLDGQPVTDLFSHRETPPIFSYTLPAAFNIDQVFFGEQVTGQVSPVAADGYMLMLKPLAPGAHTLSFSGHSRDLSAMPPLLSEFSFSATVTINVVPKGQLDNTRAHQGQAAATAPRAGVFNDVAPISDILGSRDKSVLR